MIKSANSGSARYPSSHKARPELIPRSHMSIYVLLTYRKHSFMGRVSAEDKTGLCENGTSCTKTRPDVFISWGKGRLCSPTTFLTPSQHCWVDLEQPHHQHLPALRQVPTSSFLKQLLLPAQLCFLRNQIARLAKKFARGNSWHNGGNWRLFWDH